MVKGLFPSTTLISEPHKRKPGAASARLPSVQVSERPFSPSAAHAPPVPSVRGPDPASPAMIVRLVVIARVTAIVRAAVIAIAAIVRRRECAADDRSGRQPAQDGAAAAPATAVMPAAA